MLKQNLRKIFSVILALALCLAFGAALLTYAQPMEDVTLDLSLISNEDGFIMDPENFDAKGWTVYTNENGVVTELTPDGFGGYTGLELGQTFYFSRVMEEELDSPTLQIGTVNRTFSVWLDDTLIYTDHPEQDNIIGQLRLPMLEWDRTDPIIITLPTDYQGKTLTIAQSFPEYTETSMVKAFPTSVRLYCGFAYESSLISESYQMAILAAIICLIGVFLAVAFVHGQDWGLLCLALAVLFWMFDQLNNASFHFRYFGSFDNSLGVVTIWVYTLALLVFLALRADSRRKVLWGLIAALGVSILASAALIMYYPQFSAAMSPVLSFVLHSLADWLAFLAIAAVLVLGVMHWRKENWFYHVFTPLALVLTAGYWFCVALFSDSGRVLEDISVGLQNGQVRYLFRNTLPPVMAATLITAVADAIKKVLDRRTEAHLLAQRRELTLESYENMRRQHEEVMMLRHDMGKHFRTMQEMTDEAQIKAYLEDLIGKNQKIRPVVQSGNNMLDIILNSRLGAAMDEGIRVDILRAEAPEILPLSDADLCSLVMNLVENAITAAKACSGHSYINLDIHVKSGWFALVCENSADPAQTKEGGKTKTVPKHGWGLKIIHNIVERYAGLSDMVLEEDCCSVRIAIPLG